MCREPGRHSTLDKGHEEGGSAYANAGSSLRSPPGYSRASPPKKTGVCLLYCFVLLPLISLGSVPHHHLALPVKDLTYRGDSGSYSMARRKCFFASSGFPTWA